MLKSLWSFFSHQRWLGIVSAVLAVIFLVSILYAAARVVIINEVRQQAIGIAIAVAKALDPDDLEAIRRPEDTNSAAYARISQLLASIERANPDVLYVYTMRRSQRPNAAKWDYEYIVDSPPYDLNNDGVISTDEMAQLPGTPYSAERFPAMQDAWTKPAADVQLAPDPPYPPSLSGYAPVRNRKGQTIAIVGVDISANAVSRKLGLLRATIVPLATILCLLAAFVAHLYQRQQETIDQMHNELLDISRRNQVLKAANDWLLEQASSLPAAEPFVESIQERLVPQSMVRRPQIEFDQFYLRCEMIGGDLYDVFDIDRDHIGIYMADVAGHGALAAMVAGLIKSAIRTGIDPKEAGLLRPVIFDPGLVLRELNSILQPELPPNTFLTIVYAVYNIPRCLLTLASAGHPPPLRVSGQLRDVVSVTMPIGPAIGILPTATFQAEELPLLVGDQLIFFSDGLVDAINAKGEVFGLQRLSDAVRATADPAPQGVVSAVMKALREFIGNEPLRDDCSLLVAEIRA